MEKDILPVRLTVDLLVLLFLLEKKAFSINQIKDEIDKSCSRRISIHLLKAVLIRLTRKGYVMEKFQMRNHNERKKEKYYQISRIGITKAREIILTFSKVL